MRMCQCLRITALVMMATPDSSIAAAAELRSDLPLELRAQAVVSQVVIGQPVVVDVFLINRGEEAVVTPASLDAVVFAIDVTDQEGRQRRLIISDVNPTARRLESDVRLRPGQAVARRIALERDPKSGQMYFNDAGRYQLRVQIAGFYSAEAVIIDVAAPRGRDILAWQFLQQRHGRLSALPVATTADRAARIREFRRSAESFIAEFGDTAYAHQVRLGLAEDLLVDYGNAVASNAVRALSLLDSVQRPGAVFPFADQALLICVEAQLSLGHLEDASRLRSRLRQEHPRSALICRVTDAPVDFGGSVQPMGGE